MFVHVTEDDKGQPFEVFINLGKAGGSAMADAEAMGRLMPQVHRQMRGISSDRAVGLGPNKVLSVPDAIGLALEDWMRTKNGVQGELLTTTAEQQVPTMTPQAMPVVSQGGAQMQFEAMSGGDAFIGTCPDCGSQLEFAEGCVKCHVCGFSECG
jgi:ribonucleoside-diphosphate reductase alpha chain